MHILLCVCVFAFAHFSRCWQKRVVCLKTTTNMRTNMHYNFYLFFPSNDFYSSGHFLALSLFLSRFCFASPLFILSTAHIHPFIVQQMLAISVCSQNISNGFVSLWEYNRFFFVPLVCFVAVMFLFWLYLYGYVSLSLSLSMSVYVSFLGVVRPIFFRVTKIFSKHLSVIFFFRRIFWFEMGYRKMMVALNRYCRPVVLT